MSYMYVATLSLVASNIVSNGLPRHFAAGWHSPAWRDSTFWLLSLSLSLALALALALSLSLSLSLALASFAPLQLAQL